MKFQYGLFIAFVLITVSWASSNEDGEDVAFCFSQVGEALIEEALSRPEISSQLTSCSHAILSSIATKNEYAMAFYHYAVQKYKFHDLGFNSEDPQYWNAFINTPFRKFTSKQPDLAQLIINEIILPSHPFLSQIPFTLHTADFLDQFIPDIDVFIDKVAYKIFIQQFSQILALENPYEAQILFKALVRKAKNTSFHDPEFKYHHAFLANVPFDCIQRTIYYHPEYHSNINSFISQLATILYREIAEDSKLLSDKVLAGLLPSIHSTLTDWTYESTIREYQKSLLQPIDKSYLWDPQLFYDDLLEACQALSIVENSNLPPYLKILEFVSKDTPLAHLFRHYIAQNYCQPSDLQTQHQPLFWRSLVFSSFSVFSSIFPQYSIQILHQLQLLISLDDVQTIFVYGLLGDEFSSEDPFELVSGWGHTSTVDHHLKCRTDITSYDAGKSLEKAAQSGFTTLVDLLLHRRLDIDLCCVDRVFYKVARDNIIIADIILQRRSDITANLVHLPFKNAVQCGNIFAVDLFLQRRNIANDTIDQALLNAAYFGHIMIFDLLLQCRADVSAIVVGRALESASGSGHTPIVDRLLCRSDIHADNVGWALEKASESGRTLIVDRLLCRSDILADNVCGALHKAAEGGHMAIGDLLLQRRPDIADSYIKQYLKSGTRGTHATTFDLLLQRRLFSRTLILIKRMIPI
jgi:hypothetical protein